MLIEITDHLRLTGLPGWLNEVLVDRLTFENPAWLENEKMARWNGDTPRWLRFYEEDQGALVIPRGFARQLIGLCKEHGVAYQLQDRRRTLPEVEFTFTGVLRPFQKEAVDVMAARDFGTLSAPTGSGKTVVALALIARRRQPALVVLHTKELLEQWMDRIGMFLGIPGDEVGRIGAGKRTVGRKITVALVQTLYKVAEEVAPRIGHLVVDECHRTPSRSFTEAVTVFDCRYMLGLSATPWRRDKLSRLIYWYLGDKVHEVPADALLETGDILPVDVVIRETDFRPCSDPSSEYSRMLSELTEDSGRNAVIAQDVATEARNGAGVCLVLSDRKAHCETLQTLLARLRVKSELLIGDLGARERQRVVEDLNAGKIKVLIATGALLGEGFDCRQLSTLFLATPIKFDGRLLQYLGRVLRPAPGKERAKVYDYLDPVGVLKAAFYSRRRVYATNAEPS
jgi:superfamily II DNA or RNA helicase